MGVCARTHKGYPVVGGGGWKGKCDGGVINLLHRLEFSTRARVPLVCGAAVGLEAMACARGERGASGLGLVLRWVRVIVVGIDGLQFLKFSLLLAVSSDENEETAESQGRYYSGNYDTGCGAWLREEPRKECKWHSRTRIIVTYGGLSPDSDSSPAPGVGL